MSQFKGKIQLKVHNLSKLTEIVFSDEHHILGTVWTLAAEPVLHGEDLFLAVYLHSEADYIAKIESNNVELELRLLSLDGKVLPHIYYSLGEIFNFTKKVASSLRFISFSDLFSRRSSFVRNNSITLEAKFSGVQVPFAPNLSAKLLNYEEWCRHKILMGLNVLADANASKKRQLNYVTPPVTFAGSPPPPPEEAEDLIKKNVKESQESQHVNGANARRAFGGSMNNRNAADSARMQQGLSEVSEVKESKILTRKQSTRKVDGKGDKGLNETLQNVAATTRRLLRRR